MNTFSIARWRLTLWYLLISSVLLTVFTMAALLAEHQAFEAVRQLVHSQVRGIVFNAVLQSEIDNFERDFAQRLVVFDLLMFMVSGLASYVLSGRTLRPIELMVREQEAFAADASHELRTPLANIAMEIEAHKRSKHPPTGADAELLNSIQAEVDRMRSMVAGLLRLVRTEEGQPLRVEQVELSDLVAEVLDGMAARFGERKLQVERSLDKVVVPGQTDDIRQVLLILLDNAVLYSPKQGQVRVTLQQEQAMASLVVWNSGPGISLEELPQIFKRFYRGKQVTQPGTGLGLAIARKIVERYGGSIGVASEADKGVSFRVLLPTTKPIG